MPSQFDNTELNEDLQDILSKMPNWMIQWGITVIFILFFIALFFAHWIKYPEIISGSAVITCSEPPIKLSAKQTSHIKKINFENAHLVCTGDVLIEFDHPTSIDEITRLKDNIESLNQSLNDKPRLINVMFNDLTIGEKQSTISQLQKVIDEYNEFIKRNNALDKKLLIQERINYRISYSKVVESLKHSFLIRLEDETKTYNVKQRLFEQNVTAELDFIKDKVQYSNLKDELKEFEKAIIQNNMSIQDDKLQIFEVESQRNREISNFHALMYQLTLELQSFIEDWYRNYTILAPENGRLNYLKNFQINQLVESGEVILAVVNDEYEYKAYSYIPVKGYGKIKANQIVRIKLDNYPFKEYGFLIGRVKEVSSIPTDNEYLTSIQLESGLKTSYNKELPFSPEIYGEIEIVTKKLSLFDRIFHQIQSLNL